ncbi:MAG TPA: efflux RND transporter periplasmic adaptor subunit [Stellaceae bacterium]|jgi:membrane fusion protein (multidrug efflux system)|nr:efflux RND transporter periplasmic adaptor subunit [Stellaceae bacterium]
MNDKTAFRMAMMLGIVVLVLGGIFVFEGVLLPSILKKVIASQANPPQTVSDLVAQSQDWQPQVSAIGSLRAVRGADLSAQIGGIVSAIHFDSGVDVQQGAVLVELSSADDQAKLDSLKAQAELARITYERDQRQFQAQAVSKQVVDTDAQTLKADLAQVAQQQATLDYKTIKAPFAGHIGIRQVDVGQYLAPGTAIVTLQALDPIYVDFNMPQQSLSQIAVGQSVNVSVDTFPGKQFPGKISAINSKVDLSSRNVQIRATLDNHDHKLLPGMFANIVIDIGGKQNYVTLPQTAVTYNPFGNTVYIVDNKGKDDKGQDQLVARQVFVTTGDVRGDQVAIVKGVNAGDTVVTGGQIKLRNGSPLKISNDVQPSNDANPTPHAEQ